MDTFLSNLRFASRSLRKNPGLTAVALLTLALGIGANTAIFSVVNTVVLRPLPYPESDRLVRVWPEQRFTQELLDTFVERTRTFSGLSGYVGSSFSIRGAGRPEVVDGAIVSPRHFTVLGVEPVLGRSFHAEEGIAGADAVAILGHDLWQRRFGGAERVLGRTVTLDGVERTVVGVMPAGYEPLHNAWEVWTPLAFAPGSDEYRDLAILRTVGRLAPGVAAEAARAEVRSLAAELHLADSSRYGQEGAESVGVVALHESVVSGIRPTLLVLFGAVALVLLIACANVANLLLARTGLRERELAVRTALGAGRRRLIGQLLTESALLGLAGGALGLLGAVWALALVAGRLPAGIPRAEELAVDFRVFSFALAASLLSALIFGLAPAVRATSLGMVAALRSGGRRSASGVPRHRLNHVLVAAEITLAVMVTAGAGLLVKSFWLLQQVEPGFRPAGVLALHLNPAFQDENRQQVFYRDLSERASALPGVTSAGVSNLVPMAPGGLAVDYSTTDHPTPVGQPAPFVNVRLIGGSYFETLGMPLLHGRPPASTDDAEKLAVGWINRALARRLWGEADSVGREVRFGDGSEWFTVAGVVGDVRQHRLDGEPRPEVYLPYAQAPWTRDMYLAVHSATDPMALVPAVRELVWSLDEEVAISRVQTMEQVIQASAATSRFRTLLFSSFGLLAIVLGAVGIYGVTATAVGQRTHEHGVRLALGATAGTLLRTVIGRELGPVMLGLAAGIVAALAATRALSSFLYEVTPGDPWIFAAVVVVLGGCAILAAYLPARRAARVDPATSLRVD